MAIAGGPAYTGAMAKYTKEELDRVIDKAADKAAEKAAERAAERAAGAYYEKTKHDIDLVLEATGFIKEKLKNMVTRDEFNKLTAEVRLIKYTLTDTNRDLRKLERRVDKLDQRTNHA